MPRRFLVLVIGLFALVRISVLAAVTGYILGPGDTVRVTVYQNPDLTTVSRVSEQGTITFPLLGEVTLGGMTEREAQAKISQLLQKKNIIQSPQVTVFVEDYQSQRVSVLGYVNEPGQYAVTGDSTVIDLIAEAGGISNDGGEKAIVIRKRQNATQKSIIDLYEIVQDSNSQSNLEVKVGDTIYIPQKELFYIYGEVRQPGAYPLKRQMTVMQALSVGGGLTERGTQRGLKIERRNAQGQTESLDAQLSDVLLPDDVVYIKESLF